MQIDSLGQTTFRKLVALVAHIKKQNDQILAWISNQYTSANENKFGAPDVPFTFPLESLGELDDLDVYIKDNKEIFIALASYLATFGGDTISSRTNRILRHLLSDGVAINFNYYGQRSSKRAFSDLLLKNLIVIAVKKGEPNATDKAVEDVIKVWLKHAQERLKKKEERCQTKLTIS